MSASTLTSWARAVRSALTAAGCDADALFRQAGLDPAHLQDPQARYPIVRSTRLWQLAVAATGNEAFGLAAAKRAHVTSFHALGFAVMASDSLYDAFERCARYLAVVSDAAGLTLIDAGPHTRVQIDARDGDATPAPEAMDAFAAVFVHMCRGRLGRRFAPEAVELQRPAPVDDSPWQHTFRCPVRFGARHNCLVLDTATLREPLDSGSPELAAHNETVVKRLLAERQRGDLASRVRTLLIERLPHGDPGEAAIADALHLSSRSLHRKLADQGTGYAALLRDTRETLARQYLQDGRHSVSEIAYLLGFSDASSFTRAFKRWTGVAPARARQQRLGFLRGLSVPDDFDTFAAGEIRRRFEDGE